MKIISKIKKKFSTLSKIDLKKGNRHISRLLLKKIVFGTDATLWS